MEITELGGASSGGVGSCATRASLDLLGGSLSAALDIAGRPPAGSETPGRGDRGCCVTLLVALFTLRGAQFSFQSAEAGGRRAPSTPCRRRLAPPHATQPGSGDVRPL